MYEKEKRMRLFYERKTQELEKKMKKTFADSPFTQSGHKSKDVQEMMEDIKSFKSVLPNSVKIIPGLLSDRSIDGNTAPPLIQ